MSKIAGSYYGIMGIWKNEHYLFDNFFELDYCIIYMLSSCSHRTKLVSILFALNHANTL